MIHRIADDETATCYEGCEHLVRYSTADGPSCACHINVAEGGEFDMAEAVMFAALESEDFDVNVEGEIKLKEDDSG